MRILAVALILLLPVIAAIDLTDEELFGSRETFENTFDLMYTTLGFIWDTRTIDGSGNLGPWTSIELDSRDRPRISYYDETNGDLKYVRWTGFGWLIETVDSYGDVGLYTSLALDSDDRPHISYYRRSGGDLRYAWHDGSGFQVSTVDTIRDTGMYTSIALDENNTPHISYYEKTRGTLKFAKQNGTQWEIEELDDSGNVGLYSSLALDSDGFPHISYYDRSNGDLKYIEWNGTSWQTPRVIDALGDVGLYTSLALGTSDIPHISYFDKTNGDLKFARFKDFWMDVISVDNSGIVGMYNSLALDNEGKAHISYYDKIGGDLRYATGLGLYWQRGRIHDEGDTGLYTSIDIDSDGNPHISFAGPSFFVAANPTVGMDCEREDSCSYVHMVWVETYEESGYVYQRIYYRRSTDKGETWETPVRPISGAWRHFAGFPNSYMSGPPSISVIGRTIHVVWAHEFSGGAGIFYQRSEDNGDTWLGQEVRIDDTQSTGLSMAFPESVGIYADEDYVNVVWQNGLRVYFTRSLVSEADTPDGWRVNFGKYSSVAVDWTGRVFITSFEETRGNLLISGSVGDGSFDTKTVEMGGTVGQHTSVALGSGNYPYPSVAYYDETNDSLRFASWNGTHWKIEEVDDSGDVGQYASLELDSNDFAHIAYYDATKGNLKYAKSNGTDWSISTVDDFGDVGQFASLELDRYDRPHISYYNATKESLMLASWNGTHWNIQEVDLGHVGSHSSLALDTNDLPHISYYDDKYTHLRYAHYDGEDWNIHYPDASSLVGEYTSIALDSDNRPLISYYDRGERQLKYALKVVGDTWYITVVDSNGNVGRYSSIVLDRLDGIHISYYDDTNHALKYYSTEWGIQNVQQDEMLSHPFWSFARMKHATAGSPHITGENGNVHIAYTEMATPRGDLKFASFNGTDWKVETVDDDGLVGQHSSLKLDSKGHPHIAYYDETQARLKYAKWNGTGWIIEVVDEEGNVGRECSLDLDSKDQPHITYMDLWNGPLKYAWRDDQVWHVGVVGGTVWAAGLYNSMALDSMDHPHVVYFSRVSAVTAYAYFDGERWLFRHLDSKGWQHISIALDSNDQPHVAYADSDTLAPKYTYWNGSEWVMKVVDDSSPYMGTHASIALSKDDEPMMAYYDETLADLKFARPEYPTEETARVDFENRVGTYNSIAVDDYGIAHISYYDYTKGDLKYAKWVPGGWSVETIDADGDVGTYTSIALDENGYPHISYYDDSNGHAIYYMRGPIDGSAPWSEPLLIHEKTRTYPISPRIDIEGQTIHLVWDEYEETTKGTAIYHMKSEDGGKTWPSLETKISDGPGVEKYPYRPRLDVSGATIHVFWERRETIGIGLFNSEVLYDVNRMNGEPEGWGSDRIVSPNPSVYDRYRAEMPGIRVVGNDRHLVWMFWDGSRVEEAKYIGAVDEISKIGEMGDGRKGTSSAYVVNPVTMRHELIVIGGETQSGFSDDVTIIDLTTGAEKDYCSLPEGLAYASAVWDGEDSVFVFGGLSNSGTKETILRVNLTTSVPGNRCTDTGITLSSGRYATSAIYDAVNDTAYIFGGIDGTGTHLQDIVRWPRLGVPANFGIKPSPRAFTSAVWDDSQRNAYIFGGEGGPSQLFDEVILFRPDSVIPEAKVLLNAKLPTPRSGTSSVFDGTYAYVIGGRSLNGSISEIVRFNPNGDWKNGVQIMCPEIPMGLEDSSAVASPSTRSLINGIFVIGGNNGTAISGDVWRYAPAYWGFDGWEATG